MTSERRKAIVTLCATVLIGCSSVRPLDPRTDTVSQGITVRVFEMEENAELPGVRLFVLDAHGKELFSTITDAAGTAVLPDTLAKMKPRYVLAELAGFYVTGHVWRAAVTRYEIPLKVVPHEGIRIIR